MGSVRPVGYPNTALACGSLNCQSPGLISLEQEEFEAYQNGRRIFDAVTDRGLKQRTLRILPPKPYQISRG